MSRYESVLKAIYNELEDLSVDATHLYLWSFINPDCNLAGLYKISKQKVARESKLGKRLEKTLEELQNERYVFWVDGVLWVRSRIRYLPTSGPKIAQPILRDVEQIRATHPLRVALLDYYCREHREAFDWLTPLLDTCNRVPHKPEDKFAEYGSSDESSMTHISTSVLVEAVKEEPTTDDLGFSDWLSHHATTTGMQPPKEKSKARANAAAMFRQRRQEDYSLEDLKLATVGAFNDDFRRERGYFGLVSILGPKNVHDLKEKGKRSRLKVVGGQQFQYRCRDCRSDITEAQYRNDAGRCPDDYERFVAKTFPDDAA